MCGQQRLVPHDNSHRQREWCSKPSAMLWLHETFLSIAVPDQNNPSCNWPPPGNSFCPQITLNRDATFFSLARTTKYTHRHPGQPPLYLHRGGYMSPCSVCRWRHQLVDIHTPSALKSPCDRVLSFSLFTATATLDSQGSGTSMSIPSRAGVTICSSTAGYCRQCRFPRETGLLQGQPASP